MERRHFVRIPVHLEVTYQMEREATPSHIGIIQDISQNGIRLRQYNPLRVGHRIFVTLDLPYRGKIHLRGIVVWCAKKEGMVPQLYHAGLRWTKVDSTAQTRLKAFVNEQIRGIPPTSIQLGRRSGNWRALVWGTLVAGLLALAGTLFWLSLS